MKKGEQREVLCRNRKAAHDYHFEEQHEAGLALVGSEVKSLRTGQGSLVDAHAELRNGELWLVGLQIPEYPFAHGRNHAPRRDRKLLLHKREILRLATKSRDKGYALIPTELYLKGGRIKANLALAKGKREYDKRQVERRREHDREVEAEIGRRS